MTYIKNIFFNYLKNVRMCVLQLSYKYSFDETLILIYRLMNVNLFLRDFIKILIKDIFEIRHMTN